MVENEYAEFERERERQVHMCTELGYLKGN